MNMDPVLLTYYACALFAIYREFVTGTHEPGILNGVAKIFLGMFIGFYYLAGIIFVLMILGF